MQEKDNYHKGDIMLHALEIIDQFNDYAERTIASTTSIGLKPTWGRLIMIADRALSDQKKQESLLRDLRQINNLLSHLKRQGLISGNPKKIIPMLTKEGRVKLAILQEKENDALPSTKSYSTIEAGHLTIVIFDLDESQRKKRNWFRNVLRYLGFTLLRRSVWQGRNKLPQELLDDLKKLEIVDSIHIFTVQPNNLLEE